MPPIDEAGVLQEEIKDREALRALMVPVLQTLVFLACIGSVTLLGIQHVVDAAAVTAIVGAIVGSVGVLAGVGMIASANGRNGRRANA